ncbi:MAG: sulfite exporter TauE/SafE family protein [Bacteriovorax sp.]|nr:sulfite exporter TauE/SafE family protein [Rhizobacter sp.]
MMLALAAVAALVGILIGAVGVGGVLLIPALQLLALLPIQAAMATALFTFIFTGIVGTALFQRRGSIDWALTTPLCLGGALFGVVGGWANARLDAKLLTLILALLIVAAGANTLFTSSAPRTACFDDRPRRRRALLFMIGAVTGFGSGLTGIGGPALAVPMLVLCGFPALAAIGASQVIQIVASVSGSVAHLAHGNVDLRLAALLTLFEVLGVAVGVRAAHAVDARWLRRGVGLLCVGVGAGLLVRFL